VANALLALGLHWCEQSLAAGPAARDDRTISSTTQYTFKDTGRPLVMYVRDIQMQLDPPRPAVAAAEEAMEADRTTETEGTIREAEMVSSKDDGSESRAPRSFQGRVSLTLSGRIAVDTREVVEL
jgi:hypothetical protein